MNLPANKPSPPARQLGTTPIDPRDRWIRGELEWRAVEAAYLAKLGPSRRPVTTQMGTTIQANLPEVDDPISYRFPVNNSACLQYITIDTKVRAVGQRFILVEDISNPILLSSADIERWGAIFDQPIVPMAIEWFGTPTDSDGNNRIIIVVTGAVNTHLSGVAGFVRSLDITSSRLSCPSSNDGELFYMWASDPLGTLGPALQHDAWTGSLLSVWAHETAHISQFSEMYRRYGTSLKAPKAWILEGGPALFEEIAGWSVESLGPSQNLGAGIALGRGAEQTSWFDGQWYYLAYYFGYESAQSRTAHSPQRCVWTASPGPGSSCSNTSLYYGVGANFQRWVLDHVPDLPGGPTGFTKGLYLSTSAPAGNGMSALASVTGRSLEQLLIPWQISLWADDRAATMNPAVQQPSWNLADIFGTFPVTGQLVPTEVEWGSGHEVTTSVAEASAYYLMLDGQSRPSTSLSVRRANGAALPGSVRIWFLRVK
jgi:hypothetical protein